MKKRTLATIVLSLIAVLCLAFSACFGQAEQCSITWKVDSHATVTVEGANGLPETAALDSDLVFTVTPATGYAVDYVSVNNRKLAVSSEYVVPVVGDMTIEVAVKEKLESLTVTKNVDDLVYFEGESVAPDAITVTAHYATGNNITVSDYSITPAVFMGGETEFTVKYGGVTQTVALAQAVEYKVTVNPYGGTIDAAYVSGLQANAALHNVTVDENGVLTFSYAELTEEIALPTAEQVSKGVAGDYTFTGWTNGATAFGGENSASLAVTANYIAKLVNVDSVEYQLIEEEGVQVPYLVINGEFRAAEKAYLFLYEGNRNISLKGTEIEGTRGEAFALKFDMRNLAAAVAEDGTSFKGAWMDIKIQAEDDAGNVDTMELILDDSFAVDAEQIIKDARYAYSFKLHTPEGDANARLKAMYEDNLYSFDMAFDANGNILFTGTVAEEYYGKAIQIDFWAGSTIAFYGAIDENGNWAVTYETAGIPLETTGYAHIAILDRVPTTDDPYATTLYPESGEANLANAAWVTDQATEVYGVDIIDFAAIRYADNPARVVYVGGGRWAGIIIYVRDERLSNETVTLEDGETNAWMVYSANVMGFETEEAVKEYVMGQFPGVDYMNDSNWGGSMLTEDDGTFVVETTQTSFTVKFALAGMEAGYNYFFHMSKTPEINFKKHGDMDYTTVITKGGLTYQLLDRSGDVDGWKQDLVWLSVSAAE